GTSLLRNPRTILFRPGCGDVLVNSESLNRVTRYNATTGAFIGHLILGITTPTGFAIGADERVYVGSLNDDSVIRFSGTNGANQGVFIPSGSGGLSGVVFVTFLPLAADANCDGFVTIADLDGFIQLLIDPDGYAAQHPNCDAMSGDLTGDGFADGLDIDA